LILLGVLGDLVFLTILALAGGVPALALGYIGLQITSNHAHGSMQGLMPDRFSPAQLGRGSAVKNFMDMLGLIGASLGMAFLVSPVTHNITVGVFVVIAVLVLSNAVTLIFTKEDSTLDLPQPPRENIFKQITSVFNIDLKKHSAFAWLIAGRLIFLVGALGIQSFFLYFVTDTMNMDNPVKYAGTLTTLVGIGVVIAALSSGFLTDRFGVKPIHIAAMLFLVVGAGSLAFIRSSTAVLVFGMSFGVGLGLFLTSNWALLTRLAPSEEAGKFIGLTNIATAGAGALARLFGPLIDAVNKALPNQFLGYAVLFGATAVLAVIGTGILAWKVFPSVKKAEPTA
jgi:Na+/melibiose symporter-like transporter